VLVIAWIALFLLAAVLLLQLPVSDLITAGYRQYMSILIYISTRRGTSKGSSATHLQRHRHLRTNMCVSVLIYVSALIYSQVPQGDLQRRRHLVPADAAIQGTRFTRFTGTFVPNN
jgi:hypothetical protein